MMATRFVVARHCFGGIGDHLSCLVGAWWLARRTGRALVIDWRGSRFNPDPLMQRNCFDIFFEPGRTLGGVELIADDSVGAIQYPVPIWPKKWSPPILATPDHMKHTAEEVSTVNRIVTSDEDPAEPTIVLNQWVEPPPPRDAVRQLLVELTAAASIRAEAQLFWDEHVGLDSAVAIHLRHGNGENVGLRASYWLGPFALMRQLARNARNDVHRPGLFGQFSDNMPPSLVGMPSQAAAERRFCRRVAAEFHALVQAADLSNPIPFLFCDAQQVVEPMREVLPSLVVRPKRLRDRGGGPLHQFGATAENSSHAGIRSGTVADDITHDMFVELELMRRCHGLVYMESGFSLLARIGLEEKRVCLLRPSFTNRFITKVMGRLT